MEGRSHDERSTKANKERAEHGGERVRKSVPQQRFRNDERHLDAGIEDERDKGDPCADQSEADDTQAGPVELSQRSTYSASYFA